MEPFTNYLCFRIGALARRISRHFNNLFSDLNITVGQSFVLFTLLESDGSSVKDIAANIQLDSPAVSGFVDRLLKQDMVTRQEDPEDRRSTRIYLTPKGRQVAEEALAIATEFNPQLAKFLAEGTIVGLEQTMEKIEKSLKDQKSKDSDL